MNSKNDKKPMSPEEMLVMLREKQRRKDDMDDFDADALEGFSEHVNPSEVGSLIEEINLSISKKASHAKEGGQSSNRIIWFSAAAGLVVIFLVSILFVKKKSHDVADNIALNEPKNEQLIAPGMKPSATFEESEPAPEQPVSSENQLGASTRKTLKQQEKALEILDDKSNLLDKPVQSVHGNKLEELTNTVKSDEMANGYVTSTGKSDVTQEQNLREEMVLDNMSRVAQNSAPVSNDEVEYKTLNKRSDKDFEGSADKKKEKVATGEVATMATVVPSKNSPGFSVPLSEEAAYYKGGNKALVGLLKRKLADSDVPEIVGKYYVRATVSTDGKLNVEALKQLSATSCNCIEKMKKILNSMTEWQPATLNGKKTHSEIEFEINLDSN